MWKLDCAIWSYRWVILCYCHVITSQVRMRSGWQEWCSVVVVILLHEVEIEFEKYKSWHLWFNTIQFFISIKALKNLFFLIVCFLSMFISIFKTVQSQNIRIWNNSSVGSAHKQHNTLRVYASSDELHSVYTVYSQREEKAIPLKVYIHSYSGYIQVTTRQSIQWTPGYTF